MNNTRIAAATSTRLAQANFHPTIPAESEVDMKVEWLPFTLRQVGNTDDLQKAVDLRHRAYARHLPRFADAALRTPETDDTEEGVIVLLAESKLDGSTLGTVRIQTNLVNPLNLEAYIDLPAWLNGKTIAQVRRLAVASGTSGRLVKMVLLKAVYLYCAQNHLDWILVGARRPLDRTYESLTLRDVLDGQTFVPVPGEDSVPHRVLGLETLAFHDRLVAAKHPLLNFFFYTQHPDIHPSCTMPRFSAGVAKRSNRSAGIQTDLSGS